MKSALFIKKNLLWVVFLAFAIMAIVTREDASIFISHSQYGIGKLIIWLLFSSFLGYTIYCSRKENFFKSIKRINEMHWGRQVGIDLYIGLLLPLFVIYLHGGSVVLLLWIVPVIINANLFTLLYFALNYDSIYTQFIA
jgi:hypothetical protein